jgi:hypothetical protein
MLAAGMLEREQAVHMPDPCAHTLPGEGPDRGFPRPAPGGFGWKGLGRHPVAEEQIGLPSHGCGSRTSPLMMSKPARTSSSHRARLRSMPSPRSAM